MIGKTALAERTGRIIAALLAACLFFAAAGSAGPEGISGLFSPVRVLAAEEVSTESAQPSFFPLADEAGVSVSLYDVLDFSSGKRKVFFRITNTRDGSVTINMRDFCLGGSVYLEGTGYKEVKAGQTVDYEALYLTYAFLEAERDGDKKTDFSLWLQIKEGTSWNGNVLYSGTCKTQFPEGYEPRMVCEPALSARAQEQILREDDSVRITLFSLGKYAGSDDSCPVQGIVRVDNLSGATIPVYVQSIQINGYTMDVEDTAGGQLAPGGQLYSPFQVKKRSITRSRITSISEVSLQIMTSESENTATTQSYSGGTWYPVSLSEFGTQGQDTEEGIIVYEDSYVRIGLLETGTSWSPWSQQTEFHWDFSIVNKQDRNLEIQFSDFVIDGEKQPDYSPNKYVMVAVVGAGARTNVSMLHFVDGEQPLPEIAFRVRVEAVGSGALYNYSRETVHITPGMEKH